MDKTKFNVSKINNDYVTFLEKEDEQNAEIKKIIGEEEFEKQYFGINYERIPQNCKYAPLKIVEKKKGELDEEDLIESGCEGDSGGAPPKGEAGLSYMVQGSAPAHGVAAKLSAYRAGELEFPEKPEDIARKREPKQRIGHV